MCFPIPCLSTCFVSDDCNNRYLLMGLKPRVGAPVPHQHNASVHRHQKALTADRFILMLLWFLTELLTSQTRFLWRSDCPKKDTVKRKTWFWVNGHMYSSCAVGWLNCKFLNLGTPKSSLVYKNKKLPSPHATVPYPVSHFGTTWVCQLPSNCFCLVLRALLNWTGFRVVGVTTTCTARFHRSSHGTWCGRNHRSRQLEVRGAVVGDHQATEYPWSCWSLLNAYNLNKPAENQILSRLIVWVGMASMAMENRMSQQLLCGGPSWHPNGSSKRSHDPVAGTNQFSLGGCINIQSTVSSM